MSRILFEAFTAPIVGGGAIVDAAPASLTMSFAAAAVSIGVRAVSLTVSVATATVVNGSLQAGAVGLGNGRARRIH